MDSKMQKILQEFSKKNEEIYELLKKDGASSYSHRKIFSISAYQVCLSHCRSALHLLECGVVATPLSLLRVLFEAFIRASWLCKVATDAQLQEFKEGKFIEFPSKKTILKTIQLSSFLDGKTLEDFVNKNKELFDDFTHTGDMQIIRRIQETKRNINETFETTEILFIIAFTSTILANAVIKILELDERNGEIEIAQSKYKELIEIINKNLKCQMS